MNAGAEPLVRWAPAPAMRSSRPRLRRLGGATGLVIGAVFAGVPFVPFAPGYVDSGGLWLIVPTLIAGALGGWVFGPSAATARGRLAWARVIVGLAALAVLVGAIVVGEELALGIGIAGAATVPSGDIAWISAVGLPFYGLLLGLIGTLLFGLFVLPNSLAAAVLWAVIMRIALGSSVRSSVA
jgi:hypothetical protein